MNASVVGGIAFVAIWTMLIFLPVIQAAPFVPHTKQAPRIVVLHLSNGGDALLWANFKEFTWIAFKITIVFIALWGFAVWLPKA